VDGPLSGEPDWRRPDRVRPRQPQAPCAYLRRRGPVLAKPDSVGLAPVRPDKRLPAGIQPTAKFNSFLGVRPKMPDP